MSAEQIIDHVFHKNDDDRLCALCGMLDVAHSFTQEKIKAYQEAQRAPESE